MHAVAHTVIIISQLSLSLSLCVCVCVCVCVCPEPVLVNRIIAFWHRKCKAFCHLTCFAWGLLSCAPFGPIYEQRPEETKHAQSPFVSFLVCVCVPSLSLQMIGVD
jgi:hypothetical protein